jgi:HK97 family phage major capsid protein
MNKRMREILSLIKSKAAEAKGLTEGEGKDLEKAATLMDEVDALQKEYNTLERIEKANKDGVPTDPVTNTEKASGFKALIKMLTKKPMDEKEKALVSGEGASNGENYLIPEDVRLEINELRKSYVSARELVTVETTTALSGSVNYEDGEITDLVEFEDGSDLSNVEEPKFTQKKFTIRFFGGLIPISRILQGAEKGGLMGYLNRRFVRKAVRTENKDIFAKLKAGYNGGTPKAVAGWENLKESITLDLDPACLIDGVIATNQSGWACLDKEKDHDGRPVLQPNPANPTQKLFQGLPVKVYTNAELPNIDATHFPMLYGNTKAGCTMVVYDGLEFTVSEHYLFGKNQNCMRVIEGFDTMSTDTSAYVYGSFSATV